MMHPERIRDKMEEQKDVDQAGWASISYPKSRRKMLTGTQRIEPYGWDSEDRTYYVLDDNRVYRLTEAPPAPVIQKKLQKMLKVHRAGSRASKRRRDTDTAVHIESTDTQAEPLGEDDMVSDGLGGMRWECIAVTLGEVRAFLQTIHRTRDDNEKILRDQLEGYLVPILEKQEESRARKALQRERELLNLAKMASAKRSSRIAGKVEQQKLEEQARDEEQKRRAEEAEMRREDKLRLKLEKDRDLRLMSREKRLRERLARRLQHEEELAHLSEDSKSQVSGSGRFSDRRLQAEIEKNKQALKELEEEEEDWIFDCVCGAYGQVDDGSHSIACENCNVWLHSKCVGVAEEEADRDEFHFVCGSCRRRQEAAKEVTKPTRIKLKVNPSSQIGPGDTGYSSPPTSRSSNLVVEIPRGSPTTTPAVHTSHLAISSPPSSNGSAMGRLAPQSPPITIPNSPGYPRPILAFPMSGAGKVLPPSVVFAPPRRPTNDSPAQTTTPLGYKPAAPESRRDARDLNGNTQTGQLPRNSSVPLGYSTSSQPSVVPGNPGEPSPGPSDRQTPGINGHVESTVYTPNTKGLASTTRPFYTVPTSSSTPSSTTVSSEAGISPIKHSPAASQIQLARPKLDSATPIRPPVTLIPSPQNHISTPPTKQPDPAATARNSETVGSK